MGEDLERYWAYTDNPEHADSELRAFALKMEDEIKLDNRIRKIRFILGWVALGIGMAIILPLTRFVSFVIEAVQRLMA